MNYYKRESKFKNRLRHFIEDWVFGFFRVATLLLIYLTLIALEQIEKIKIKTKL